MANTPAVKTKLTLVDGFTAPFRAITSVVKGAVAPFTNAFGAIGRVGAVAAKSVAKLAGVAAAAKGAIVAGVGEFAQGADEIRRFARAVDVSSESLQELRLSGQMLGVDSTKVDDALKELTLRLGEMAAGEGALSGALDKISPKLKNQLKGAKDTESAFVLITQAMSQLSTQQQRMFLSDAAFGGAGEDVVRFGELGAKGLAELRQQVRAYGVQSDATLEQTQKAANQWKAVKLTIHGVAASIGGALAPALAPLVERLSAWIGKNRELISQRIVSFVTKLSDAISAIDWGAVVDGLRAAWAFVQPTVRRIVTWVSNNWGEIKRVTKAAFDDVVFVAKRTFTAVVDIVSGIIEPISVALSGVRQAFTGFLDFLTGIFTLDMGKVASGLTDVWDGVATAFSGIIDGVRVLWSGFASWFGDMWERFAPQPLKDAWNAFAGAIRSVFEAMKPVIEWVSERVEWLTKKLEWLLEQLAGINPANAVSNAISAVQTSLTAAASNAGVAAVARPVAPNWATQAMQAARVQVDFANMPQGATAKDTTPANAAAPKVTLNLGARKAGT